ncbi:LAFA_0D16556g1_1 [Lachancea sp. 'fantastica']|nr:LAFA_0D16556g1_1 [Lachancea sp. 'fantastica']
MAVQVLEILVTSFLFLSVVFAIGCVPIYYVKNRSSVIGQPMYLTVLSLIGVGMLLGTAIMLVIPEGIEACLGNNGNVGINLLIGFLVVYCLDQAASVLGQMPNRGAFAFAHLPGAEITSLKDVLNPKKMVSSVFKNQVVFALVIHGFSDGLAMGASANSESLKIATLVAIIIHKIPAVLSLSSLMVTKQNLPTWEAVSNLLAFAASTPLAYLLLSLINLGTWGPMEWISGNILLMSGGSLLYAGVSALLGNHQHSPTETAVENFAGTSAAYDVLPKDMTPFEVGETVESETTPRYGETVYVLGGVVIPVVVSYLIREKS